MKDQPILFIIPGACSLGSQITLEWLKIPYKVGITTPEIRQSEQFRKINPAGKVGALKDGDVVIGENLAILLYLADNYASHAICPPHGSNDRALIYQWLSHLSSTLHPAFQHFNYPNRFVEDDYVDKFRELAEVRLLAILQYIDNNLSESGFFLSTGATIVDAQAYGLLRWCKKHSRGENLVDLTAFAKIRNFFTRMEQNSAVQNALLIEQQQLQMVTDSLFAGYFEFG
jgi:glutathione S-transferase